MKKLLVVSAAVTVVWLALLQWQINRMERQIDHNGLLAARGLSLSYEVIYGFSASLSGKKQERHYFPEKVNDRWEMVSREKRN